LKFKKLISIICIIALIGTSSIGVYGATSIVPQTNSNVSEQMDAPNVPSQTMEPADLSFRLSPSVFLAHSNVYNGSYYSELSPAQQSYYNAFHNSYLNTTTDMPNGFSGTIEFAPYGQILLTVDSNNQWTDSALATVNAVYKDIFYAYFAFINDYPSLFWAGAANTGLSVEYYSPGVYAVSSLNATPEEKYAGALNSVSDFVTGVQSAKQTVDGMIAGEGDYYTLKAIHDYLCNIITYNTDAVGNSANHMDAHSAGPVFTEDDPLVVCEGYGKAFKVLCDEYDIPCALIVGTGNGGAHLWNYVQINGKWYAVDVTWDDQTYNGQQWTLYNYFLVGADNMTDHTPDGAAFTTDRTISYAYPALNKDNYEITEGSCAHQWDSGLVIASPTCTQSGKTQYTCTLCSQTTTKTVAALGHNVSSKWTVKKATMSSNGSKYHTCSRCSEKFNVTTIRKINSVNLSDTAYTYNGKKKTPSVTVYDSAGKKLVNGTDYSVSYQSGRTKIERYKVTVTFTVNYSGSKDLYFTIGPKNPSSVKTTLYGYDDVKVSWSKVSGASGYVVYYKKASASSYTKLKTTTSTSYKKSNLSDGVKYDFKVVAYKTAGGNKCYNAGKTSSITTLKKITGVKAKKSSSKIKISWTNIGGETGYQISQSTSKSKTKIVATYKTTSGKSKTIKATKGKTYYYKVRAYKTVGGKKIYGPWSSVVKYKRK